MAGQIDEDEEGGNGYEGEYDHPETVPSLEVPEEQWHQDEEQQKECENKCRVLDRIDEDNGLFAAVEHQTDNEKQARKEIGSYEQSSEHEQAIFTG